MKGCLISILFHNVGCDKNMEQNDELSPSLRRSEKIKQRTDLVWLGLYPLAISGDIDSVIHSVFFLIFKYITLQKSRYELQIDDTRNRTAKNLYIDPIHTKVCQATVYKSDILSFLKSKVHGTSLRLFLCYPITPSS